MSFLSNLFNTNPKPVFEVRDSKDQALEVAAELIEKLNEAAVKQLNTEVSLRGVLRIQDVIIDDLIDELSVLTEKVEYLSGEVRDLAEEIEDCEAAEECLAEDMLAAAKYLIDSVTDAGHAVEFTFEEDFTEA